MSWGAGGGDLGASWAALDFSAASMACLIIKGVGLEKSNPGYLGALGSRSQGTWEEVKERPWSVHSRMSAEETTR